MLNEKNLDLIKDAEVYSSIQSNFEKTKTTKVSGLKNSATAYFLSSLKTPLFILTKEIDKAREIYYDLITLLKNDKDIELLPPIEFLDTCKLSPSIELKSERILVFKKLFEGNIKILVSTYSTFFVPAPDKEKFITSIINIKRDDDLNLVNLVERLITLGYKMETFVEKRGEISVRGGILDIYPMTDNNPIRFEFDGDRINSIRYFDLVTQRSISLIENIEVLPADENVLGENSILNYFSKEVVIFIDETTDFEEEKDKFKEKINLNGNNIIYNSHQIQHEFQFGIKDLPVFHGNIKLIIEELNRLQEKNYNIQIYFNNEGEKNRFIEILIDNKCEAKVDFIIGSLSSGFYFEDIKLAVLTDDEIFGRYKNIRYEKGKKRFTPFKDKSLTGFTAAKDIVDISTGEFVVHINYGLGKFLGLKSIKLQGGEKDFITLEYEGNDKLYVPVEDINKISKYIGFEAIPPLSKLGTSVWEKTKEKVKESANKVAMELLELYAARETLKGFAFSKDTPWQMEFEDSFIYDETEDQLKTIKDIKKDMEEGRSIDRLICGDVGFGKTEVAIRAAFKAVLDGKQVAVICPTTILAEQHFNTFSERMGGYPIHISMLSRFTTKNEQKNTVLKLKSGSIDLVIGTHRLIQEDIDFKDLGLLIIDDEQKFGVIQKEKLKKLKKSIYCLSLSATPIPRTLYFSLSGIREISNINSPPAGRSPIQTYILEYNEKIIKGAILKEIERGGQIYYVYNKVETIEKAFNKIKELIPDIKVAIAHGQMPGSKLEKVMLDFYKKKYNCLVCSTIIESGLDNPDTNTIIIENADEFGLSQLYQLRGRVGRSKLQAYAYLMYPSKKVLTEVARRRLDVIEECDELSLGFKIAIKDLELRGAGNILGKEQHGDVVRVGFELYLNLLREAVLKIKGVPCEPEEIKEDVEINIKVDAFISETYIPDSFQRINIYKDMMATKNNEDLHGIKEELLDRFGRIPVEIENLFLILEIKFLARKYNVKVVFEDKEKIYIKYKDGKAVLLTKDIKKSNIEIIKNYLK
ncbi:MAG: transcription-repair coupling factor [Candidatus Firestonebacteria bacterium]